MQEYQPGQRVLVDPVGADEFVGIVRSVDPAAGTVVVDALDEPELSDVYPVEALSRLAG